MERLDDSKVKDLIRIANAGVKRWFLFFPIRYGLAEQLEAVRKLGESRSSLALEYLRSLQTQKDWSESPNIADHYSDFGGTYHPNARGRLARALRSTWSNVEAPMNCRENKERDKEAYSTLASAIMRLEKELPA